VARQVFSLIASLLLCFRHGSVQGRGANGGRQWRSPEVEVVPRKKMESIHRARSSPPHVRRDGRHSAWLSNQVLHMGPLSPVASVFLCTLTCNVVATTRTENWMCSRLLREQAAFVPFVVHSLCYALYFLSCVHLISTGGSRSRHFPRHPFSPRR
jgi:hypothetical protein